MILGLFLGFFERVDFNPALVAWFFGAGLGDLGGEAKKCWNPQSNNRKDMAREQQIQEVQGQNGQNVTEPTTTNQHMYLGK